MTKYCLLPKCIVKKEKEKHVELEHLSLISIEALHEIKCSCGMNSLHGACTDNSLTVSFKETSQHLKEGVRVGRSCGVVCVCVCVRVERGIVTKVFQSCTSQCPCFFY